MNGDGIEDVLATSSRQDFKITLLSKSLFLDKEGREYLAKWDILPSMCLLKFRYDVHVSKDNIEEFLLCLFRNQSFLEQFKVRTGRGKQEPLGSLKRMNTALENGLKIQFSLIPATVTNMGFFDRLYEHQVAREKGAILKCFPKDINGFPITDKLRLTLLDDQDDLYSIFSESDRKELIFKIFQHLCLGGPYCQYEDELEHYLNVTKDYYKNFVSVS
eukprot:TRINITY_DN3100_c0_g1_i1.p2 TRINITY_DN3100_c0_g1~~TRINITY_DN3100_c0_g1_i1.p2  ORF type:complete len:217 (+),score=25.56 TRINITY_DN3100_c0_g1_i1:833-1483(+)